MQANGLIQTMTSWGHHINTNYESPKLLKINTIDA